MGEGANHRIRQVADFAHLHLQTTAPTEELYRYRWEHTLRVSNYGKRIGSVEGASPERSVVGCLLHDVAKFEAGVNKDHGRLSARVSRPILQGIGYSTEDTSIICHAIAVHVDGIADFGHPETVEARVVTDADNIDRFSALRIIHWCMPTIDDYAQLLKEARSRLTTLRQYRERGDVLQTRTGNELFASQLNQQIAFFEDLLKESQLTTLPSV